MSSCEKILICEREKQEQLVPVLTFVVGLSRPKAVSAWLSFLSLCHRDCHKNIRLANALSSKDQLLCMSILDEVIDRYLNISKWTQMVHARFSKAAYGIMRRLPEEHRQFLKERFISICGQSSYEIFWKKLERASDFEDVSRDMSCSLSVMHLKKYTDFSAFFIALTFLYGCGNKFYKRLAVLENELQAKYGDRFPFEKIGLSLWPLDFSFVQNEEYLREDKNEHLAVLKAARVINPDIRVQVCANSQLWSRDLVAWLDHERSLYIKAASDQENRFGRGALSEGGNIVTGIAKDKFIIVALGSVSNIVFENFHHEMNGRNIKTYALPDGFLWSRDPQTQKDMILDSIHIDAVLNVVPAVFTTDDRPKIIVDPYYYSLIKTNPDFLRFLREQEFLEADIVIVDERELYLNLPNFSVLEDPSGLKKMLFNKDKGCTLPRLKLRLDLLIQPEIEIVNMAGSFGSIRCATNMLPSSYVKNGSVVEFEISEGIQPNMATEIIASLKNDEEIIKCLSKLFISTLSIQILEQETPSEFDEFTQTAYIYLTPDKISNSVTCNEHIRRHVCGFSGELSRRLGIMLTS
ncbi:MAG: hypothetical protein WA705_25220 [Candidatus Ozemobacteraceae bacterium]